MSPPANRVPKAPSAGHSYRSRGARVRGDGYAHGRARG